MLSVVLSVSERGAVTVFVARIKPKAIRTSVLNSMPN